RFRHGGSRVSRKEATAFRRGIPACPPARPFGEVLADIPAFYRQKLRYTDYLQISYRGGHAARVLKRSRSAASCWILFNSSRSCRPCATKVALTLPPSCWPIALRSRP